MFKRTGVNNTPRHVYGDVDMYLEASIERESIDEHSENSLFFHETNALLATIDSGVILFSEVNNNQTWFNKVKAFIGRVIDAIIKFFKDLFGKGKTVTVVDEDNFKDILKETIKNDDGFINKLKERLAKKGGEE